MLQEIINAFAPARCVDCLCEDTWYCERCRAHAPIATQSCIICKTERPRGTTCINCREETNITGIVSVAPYSNHALQRGIEWLKFKGIRPIADTLAGLIIPHLARIDSLDALSRCAILVPIPLHKNKLRQRGFNQSEDVAKAISALCNIQLAPILRRKKATKSQAKLSHDERPHNMHEAFEMAISKQEYSNIVARKPIIILIDDVSTTGATLMSASRAFPELPDVKIWCATIARG
ncbi:MAG: hypothetical protein K8Q97_03505 [Candidatus Andersenbacteria bacterium]|nr:hypothetical protein [Candidatus Andersenbacteria bacterium]